MPRLLHRTCPRSLVRDVMVTSMTECSIVMSPCGSTATIDQSFVESVAVSTDCVVLPMVVSVRARCATSIAMRSPDSNRYSSRTVCRGWARASWVQTVANGRANEQHRIKKGRRLVDAHATQPQLSPRKKLRQERIRSRFHCRQEALSHAGRRSTRVFPVASGSSRVDAFQ